MTTPAARSPPAASRPAACASSAIACGTCAGDGTAGTANFFVGIQAESEAEGLFVDENTYCGAPTADDVRFFWIDEALDFEGWQAVSGTDPSSTPLGADDPACDF